LPKRQVLANTNVAVELNDFFTDQINPKENKPFVEFIRDQWQNELGIKVSLKAQEVKDLYKNRKDHKYRGVAFGTWTGDYPDPYSFLGLFEAENESGWNDESYQKLLSEANRETDQTKRYQKLTEAEKYLLEQMPLIPLVNRVNRFLCKPYVKNLSLNPLEQVNWREVYVDSTVTADKL
jgi:oligopeptide transport system substrate-binding protein